MERGVNHSSRLDCPHLKYVKIVPAALTSPHQAKTAALAILADYFSATIAAIDSAGRSSLNNSDTAFHRLQCSATLRTMRSRPKHALKHLTNAHDSPFPLLRSTMLTLHTTRCH
jgi:hypothetical protein